MIAGVGQGLPPDAALAGGAAGKRLDVSDCLVVPGFADLHVHGGGGADVMDGTAGALQAVARAHAAGGTTSWVASTVAAPAAQLRRVLAVAAPLLGRPLAGATLVGVHLEGPCLASHQRGAHALEHLRPPGDADVESLLEALGALPGPARMTAAPELPGGLELGRALRRLGIAAAIGHSDAELDTVRRAVGVGYTHVTHLYSCTSGLRVAGGYKTPGINEAALLLDDLSVELIGDGHHVPPSLLQLVHKVKGSGQVCLVTDAMRATGLGPGRYRLGEKDVLVEGGVARLPDRSKFAGSVCTMAQAVRTAVGAGLPFPDALRMASEVPARLLGLAARKGQIAPGRDADLVVLDRHLVPRLTLAGGRVVYAAPSAPQAAREEARREPDPRVSDHPGA